jgi:hypothetical protein
MSAAWRVRFTSHFTRHNIRQSRFLGSFQQLLKNISHVHQIYQIYTKWLLATNQQVINYQPLRDPVIIHSLEIFIVIHLYNDIIYQYHSLINCYPVLWVWITSFKWSWYWAFSWFDHSLDNCFWYQGLYLDWLHNVHLANIMVNKGWTDRVPTLCNQILLHL